LRGILERVIICGVVVVHVDERSIKLPNRKYGLRSGIELALAVALLGLVAATAAFAASGRSHATDTLVFGASADPVSLDGSLANDGESIRVIKQIVETLVAQKPGTTNLVPDLATSWKHSRDGKTWTFALRRGVKFHDGTSFNAKAVCANFDRWFNYTGALQSPSVSYYYSLVFGGFKTGSTAKNALYRSCTTRGPASVVIKLTRPFGPFLGALTLIPFGIQSPTAMKKYGANQGSLSAEGVFRPSGTYSTQHPSGTGPFKFSSWRVGDKLTLVRNDAYWGKKAFLRRLIFRPIADNAARLQALQTGEIDGYDNVAPQDVVTVQKISSLKLIDRPSFNVGYVTINRSVKPFDDLRVRQAVAYGLDRASVVQAFYAGRGSVASQFQPPAVMGFNSAVTKYPYDPAKSRQLLQQAGLTLPVEVEFWYPTDVARPYMPDPSRNFQAFSASLEKAGFKVVPRSAPWRPDYLGRVLAGTGGALNLLGQTGDYADPESFLGILRSNVQFGMAANDPLYAKLDAALKEPDQAKRAALYKAINAYIADNLPGVPYVNTKPALAFKKTVVGFLPSPTLNDNFELVRFSG
jgi:peptide/nickel transport system substrate-binding protein